MKMRKTMKPVYLIQGLMLGAMITLAQLAVAGSAAMSDDGAAHKLVIQVSSADPVTHKIALNNAVNIQKAYGMDNVAVEVVAYGPGLTLLTDKSTESQRVASLAMQDITFSACGNTMKKVAKKTGSMPVLIDGVQVVPAGVPRIMELQEGGYAYIRP
jgi:intracellular sulfur oxidation DsrE/DsrF family protein